MLITEREISISMRDLLIDHLDQTKVAIIRNHETIADKRARTRAANRSRSQQAALKRGWIKRTPDKAFTLITESGRRVMVELLADWADAMARAQLVIPPGPSRCEPAISAESAETRHLSP